MLALRSRLTLTLWAARCSEPPHTGPCRASLTRWYYNPMDRKCVRFTYGGCDANGNNFEEEPKCERSCSGVTGEGGARVACWRCAECSHATSVLCVQSRVCTSEACFSVSRRMKEANQVRGGACCLQLLLWAESADGLAASSPGHIALAVLLAVAILALLAILSYCVVKSRRGRAQRPGATGPAHVALSEQDTLVYNSTTKPV